MIITNQSNISYDSVLPDGQTEPGVKDSNIVSTEILNIGKLKSTAKTFIKEGEQTTQQVTFTNTSNYVLQNLFFTDSLSDGAEHIPGSVFIDGVSYPLYDVVAGFALPDLPVGNNTTISYSVVANNPKTKSIVDNFATLQFDVSDPISGSRTFNQDTITVSFAVISTNLSITKSVDKTYAIAGDNLHYTSLIENKGSQKIENMIFKDILQSGITFVDGSVKIDGVSYPLYNPITGFALDDIDAGGTRNVEFDVTVN